MLPRLPDVSGKLFLTFTYDPSRYPDPAQAFATSRDKLRKVFYRLRKGVRWQGKRYRIDAPYCVKVEFHADGRVHYHCIFLTTRFLPGELLNHLWDLGRTNVQRIRTQENFHYLLKYVTKGGSLPEWVKDLKRIRIFQTSHGFYRKDDDGHPGNSSGTDSPDDPEPDAEPIPDETDDPKTAREDDHEEANAKRPTRRASYTIRERLALWRKQAVYITATKTRTVTLEAPFLNLLGQFILSAARSGNYLGSGRIQITNTKEILQWLKTTKQPRADLQDVPAAYMLAA